MFAANIGGLAPIKKASIAFPDKKGGHFVTFVKQFQQRTAMLNAFKKTYGVLSYGISCIKSEHFFLFLKTCLVRKSEA